MARSDTRMEYERKVSEAQARISQARLHHTSAAAALLIVVGLSLALGLAAIRKQVSFWWLTLPLPVAFASARHYGRYRRAEYRLCRLKRFYDEAIQRMRGEWLKNPSKGEAFNDSRHIYARDLDIFGDGSLFQLLCTARTGVGRRGLSKYLLEAPALEETLARQQAVRELRDRTDLREGMALLGPFGFSESNWETFANWLDAPSVRFRSSLSLAIFITSAVLACFALSGLAGLLPWAFIARWTAPIILFHSVVGVILHQRVAPMIDSLRALFNETRVIREGLELLECQEFTSVKLRGLTGQVRHASRSLRRLERLLNALSERNKEWFYHPSLALMVGTQLCMAAERWRTRNRSALRTWLDAWAEFEALNALASYAYENPENTFPEFVEGHALFEARAIGHPLLLNDTCVRNDVNLNCGSRFYVVSGSNMSGKSTLLRAIGLNAVLALAGAPVCAQGLRMSQLSICASLSVSDSLLDGRSKFLAEVDRLREAIELAANEKPVLFLIDEIFSGTNSLDRRVAAEAVIGTLISRGAIGALSTHDLALSEIAGKDGLCGVNVHMGSKECGNAMDFDYRLKPGVTKERNALDIARMVGVPVQV